jgi:hypothetical protein
MKSDYNLLHKCLCRQTWIHRREISYLERGGGERKSKRKSERKSERKKEREKERKKERKRERKKDRDK